MNEINRLQQLAGLNEIRINQPNMFKKIPLKSLLQEFIKDQTEFYKENDWGEESLQTQINMINECNDLYDIIGWLGNNGHNKNESFEIIFDTLVDING